MSLRRIDAPPAPCSCIGNDAIPADLSVQDTEDGPRIHEVTEARGDGAYLAAAIAREEARARASHCAGPPEGAHTLTRDRPTSDTAAEVVIDVHVDTSGMSPLDAAHAREEARARLAAQAGPPEGAMVRRG